ncbi:surface protein, ECM binding protein-like protein A [Staphylococcus aureus]|uniref:Surface protein, ECM binding protein-like protein A n=1 Tax=Staphylococcus aureus TaxID=1280 RepID=A0A380E3T4_STAAU|nr:surface protein, ECM binding protein-like protein A [Staphylococcus aureus]
MTNAKGALNGNHNLEQAKSNANTTINGLQHLTTAQKDKLKQQVQQAQNVAGVDTVKSSANTLNGAMGTLRNSIQDNTATKNGQNYLDSTERTKQTITMLLIVLMVSLMQQAIQIWMLMQLTKSLHK